MRFTCVSKIQQTGGTGAVPGARSSQCTSRARNRSHLATELRPVTRRAADDTRAQHKGAFEPAAVKPGLSLRGLLRTFLLVECKFNSPGRELAHGCPRQR